MAVYNVRLIFGDELFKLPKIRRRRAVVHYVHIYARRARVESKRSVAEGNDLYGAVRGKARGKGDYMGLGAAHVSAAYEIEYLHKGPPPSVKFPCADRICRN